MAGLDAHSRSLITLLLLTYRLIVAEDLGFEANGSIADLEGQKEVKSNVTDGQTDPPTPNTPHAPPVGSVPPGLPVWHQRHVGPRRVSGGKDRKEKTQ